MSNGHGKKKGSGFERQVAKTLSLWWTDGKRDDVMWRTQSSGGRATQRTKANRTLAGQYGDLTYTDPIAKPLFDLVVVECKCGYGRWSPMDVIAKPMGKSAKKSILLEWLDQVETERELAGVPYFFLIVKRNKESSVICIPHSFVRPLRSVVGDIQTSRMDLKTFPSVCPRICFYKLNEFLKAVEPSVIRNWKLQ